MMCDRDVIELEYCNCGNPDPLHEDHASDCLVRELTLGDVQEVKALFAQAQGPTMMCDCPQCSDTYRPPQENPTMTRIVLPFSDDLLGQAREIGREAARDDTPEFENCDRDPFERLTYAWLEGYDEVRGSLEAALDEAYEEGYDAGLGFDASEADNPYAGSGVANLDQAIMWRNGFRATRGDV